MTDKTDLPGGTPAEALDRFAEAWWNEAPADDDRYAVLVAPQPRLVIRAERV